MSENEEKNIIANRYKILEKIGDGGMGNIYLAEDMQLPRRVAIKTIRNELKNTPEVQKRIERECKLHAIIGVHPNIVALYDRIIDADDICLIMEYVKGITLDTFLKKAQESGNQIPEKQIRALTTQILNALSHIHNLDILHRDIKPSNIILVDHGHDNFTAKLMDFGIATPDSDEQQLTQLTTLTAGGPGTPAYMAPERIDSETFGENGPPTDLYSVGVILYELLGAHPPFRGTMTEIFTGHLAKEPDFTQLPGSTPATLISVLKKSLAKKQEERFQHAEEFVKALNTAIPETVGTPSSGSSASALDKTILATELQKETIDNAILQAKEITNQQRKKLWPILVSLALIICLGLGGYWYFKQSDPQVAEQPLNESKPVMNATSTQAIDSTTNTAQNQNVKIYKPEPIETQPTTPAEETAQQTASQTSDPLRPGYKVHGVEKEEARNALETFNQYRTPEVTPVKPDVKPVTAEKQQYSKPRSSQVKKNNEWVILKEDTKKVSN